MTAAASGIVPRRAECEGPDQRPASPGPEEPAHVPPRASAAEDIPCVQRHQPLEMGTSALSNTVHGAATLTAREQGADACQGSLDAEELADEWDADELMRESQAAGYAPVPSTGWPLEVENFG